MRTFKVPCIATIGFAFVCLTLSVKSFSQVTKTVGATGADYTTVKTAFDDINAGILSGDIVLQIVDNTTETASAVLNTSGTGSASFTSVLIYPAVTGKSISGNLAVPLIDLNGADNVTIDGRVNATGTVKDLVITNTNTSATAGVAAIRLYNDATYNTVKYCIVKASGTSNTSGIILITTASVAGNSNNLFDHNDITSAVDASRTCSAIYAAGSGGFDNSSNTISNNNFYNFLRPASTSYGINIGSNNTAFTITGNSFYETNTFTPASAVNYIMLYVSTAGVNFNISNNYIGGSSPQCGSAGTVTAFTKAGNLNNYFYGMWLSVGTSVPSSVQGNVISNINYSNSGAGQVYMINVLGGSLNIGTISGNVIGAATGNNSIYTYSGATYSSFYGIMLGGSGIVDCQNNVIGSVTVTAASANGAHFYGIRAGGTGTTIISNNTIGSTDPGTSNSIYASSIASGNVQMVCGITCTGTGSVTVSGNTISKMTNATTNNVTGTAGYNRGIDISAGNCTVTNNIIHDLSIDNANNSSSSTLALAGIVMGNTTANTQIITGNTVYKLTCGSSGYSVHVAGIFYGGSTTAGTISKNLIYNLSPVNGNTGTSVYGIKISSGVAVYSNNVITLGLTGGVTADGTYYGIYENGAANNNNSLYFNTVYLGGTPATGTGINSYAFYSAANTNTRNFRNNIFVNARSNNGATGTHYAAYFAYTTAGSMTLGYNDYYAPGTGGMLGRFNNADVSTLPIITNYDVRSMNVNPGFASAGGILPANYLPSDTSLMGVVGTGILVDFANNTRSLTMPAMGAFDYTVGGVVFVSSTAGTLSTCNYPSLKAAFDSVNTGFHQGDISIQIKSSTSEVASAVLNASGSGSASYTSVLIYPATAGLAITGSLAAPLIDLNGASNVTIDGRVNATGSSLSMAVINYSTSNTAGTSTIRFINDAHANTVKYCSVKGSGTSIGIVAFSTTTGASGNDDNLIDRNDITNADGTSRPVYALYSLGSSAATQNSGNIISNNNFYNFLSRGTASYGINLGSYNTNWTITNNSFYETASLVPTAGVAYNIIYINSTAADNYFTITGNYIGGSSPQCGTGGSTTSWTKTNAFDNAFTGIYFNVGANTPTSIQGNVIRNFTWANAAATTWYAIQAGGGTGNMDIGTVTGNTIGAETGNASIAITSGGTATFAGINLAAGSIQNCYNNTIGAVTMACTGTAASTLYGIWKTAGGVTRIVNNKIGSTDAGTTNSLYVSATATAAAQPVYGIYSSGTGGVTINANTISKVTNGTTNTVIGTTGLVQGIFVGYPGHTVTGNVIHDLTIANANRSFVQWISAAGIVVNTSTAGVENITGNAIYRIFNNYASFTGGIAGILYQGPLTASVISKNFIHSLSVSNGSTTASVYGIKIGSGLASYSNNIISVGSNGASNVDGIIYGIYENGVAANDNSLYFNTVYISGTPASGTANSYALYSAVNTNTRDFRNNIFFNARSNSTATGVHYGIFLNYATTGALTLDYNDYYITGTGGTLGYFNAAPVTSLPIVTGLDVASSAVNPQLSNAGGTAALDYFSTASIPGTTIAGITTDYFENLRSGTPLLGALEVYHALPLSWVKFTARLQSSQVLLDWATVNESGIKNYLVQTSMNGISWKVIGTVNAQNRSAGAAYQFIHTSPAGGHNYYRLMQNSNNGTSSYSQVVDTYISDERKVQLMANPVQSGLLVVKLPTDGILSLFNLNGQILRQLQVGAGMQSIDVSRLSSGMYFLRFENETVRFIIE